jgi:hypothetical protein
MGQPGGMPPQNVPRLAQVYSPATWDVYDRLDASLNPAGPGTLHELAAEYLRPGDVVLDAGCRDAGHLVRLVSVNDVDGVGVDPVPIHIERARAAVDLARLGDRITLHTGVVQHAEEGSGPASRALLRISRLRRQRDEIVAVHGQDIYDHVEANLHWTVFTLLGKLLPMTYILRGPSLSNAIRGRAGH